MKEKTLLVIVPGKEVMHDSVFYLLVAKTGECLASHICSNYSFAYGDLYDHRPERKKKWTKRFGEIEVKYVDDTDLTIEELQKRNKETFEKEQKNAEQT